MAGSAYRNSLLNLNNFSEEIKSLKPQIDNFISLALQEDVGSGDHSTLSSISKNQISQAKLLVKANGVLAGCDLAEYIFQSQDKNTAFTKLINDGQIISKGDIVFNVEGNTQSLLMLERLVLNCMQRMSGIATQTHHLVKMLEGMHAKILDTRKTTPGIRFLEKWAVRIGGGTNHRFGLFDMIMLKDNHIDAAGGITKAIQSAKKYLQENNLSLKVEVETRNLDEVKEAVDSGGTDRIMLDNFTPELIKEALKIIDSKYETEASGGINESNIKAYAETGVDFISTSSITHSVSSLDLSLKIY